MKLIEKWKGDPIAKLDHNKWVETSKEITIESIRKTFKEMFTSLPLIWTESSFETEEVTSIFKKSKFYKHYNK